MQARRYASTFADTFSLPVSTFIVPYSGGLDSTYVLHMLQQNRPDARRIAVHLAWDLSSTQGLASLARGFGADFVGQDGCHDFFRDFLPAAIRHNALYLNRYPISSSLTRPQIACAVFEVWRSVDNSAIVHSATHMQNTARRFERSWAALAPDAIVCAPYVATTLSRADKAKALSDFGFKADEAAYSVDVTPIARVIENGVLEDPANLLPESGVFSWTRDIADAPTEPVDLEIDFDEGIPVAIDKQFLSLQAIVEELNSVGGRHGIGRFSGLEDTAFNVKNHEIREAPAIWILITGHQAIENAVLSADELMFKNQVDQRWTTLVASGGWFDDLTLACSAFSSRLDVLITGSVRLRLHKGSVGVRRVSSPNSLSYTAFTQAYNEVVAGPGAGLLANIRDLPVLVRHAARSEEGPLRT